ncbi:MAG TPA: lasso peptide biosynthesis B2 protein [Thermoanaerobaculia bacterium]|nr:lasso peptide biosynthesis B2 protein [Thermoanaerobaculia bacterium]
MRDVTLPLRCLLSVGATEVLWRAMKLPALLRLVGERPRPPVRGRDERALCDRACRWIERIYARMPGRATCLKRAVALSIAFRLLGVGSRIVIGVSKSEGEFLAHAWVEAAGTEYARGSESSFEALVRV